MTQWRSMLPDRISRALWVGRVMPAAPLASERATSTTSLAGEEERGAKPNMHVNILRLCPTNGPECVPHLLDSPLASVNGYTPGRGTPTQGRLLPSDRCLSSQQR